MRKLVIYVQVPFCQTKCTYCNFHTGVVASSRFAPYVEAVCREIRGHLGLLGAAGGGGGGGVDAKTHSRVSSGENRGMGQGGLGRGAVGDRVSVGGWGDGRRQRSRL